ncbi:MAG: hypothetical protein AB1586_23370 [Pseudomonadota bacterium]
MTGRGLKSAALCAGVVLAIVTLPVVGSTEPARGHHHRHAAPQSVTPQAMPDPRIPRPVPDMSGGNAAAGGNNANSMSGSNSAGENANGRSSGGGYGG